MTFSRAQMIEAYEAGYCDNRPGHPNERAIRYVGSLQNARETDEKARGKSDQSENVWVFTMPEGGAPGRSVGIYPADRIGQLEQKVDHELGKVREHIIKSEERELVLAKVLGSVIFTIAMYYAPRVGFSEERITETLAYWVKQLNTVFPELTPEE